MKVRVLQGALGGLAAFCRPLPARAASLGLPRLCAFLGTIGGRRRAMASPFCAAFSPSLCAGAAVSHSSASHLETAGGEVGISIPCLQEMLALLRVRSQTSQGFNLRARPRPPSPRYSVLNIQRSAFSIQQSAINNRQSTIPQPPLQNQFAKFRDKPVERTAGGVILTGRRMRYWRMASQRYLPRRSRGPRLSEVSRHRPAAGTASIGQVPFLPEGGDRQTRRSRMTAERETPKCRQLPSTDDSFVQGDPPAVAPV